MANEKSRDYRRVFANSFGVGLSDNEISLMFGYNQNPQQPDNVSEEVMVILTHRSLKLLAHTLGKMVERWERDYGEISLPAGRIEELNRSLDAQSIEQNPA